MRKSNNKLLKIVLITLFLLIPFSFANAVSVSLINHIQTTKKEIAAISLSPDNNFLLVAFNNKPSITMWNLRTKSKSQFNGAADSYNNLYFSNDSKKFYTVSIKNSMIEQFSINKPDPIKTMDESLKPFHTANSGITATPDVLFVTNLFPPIISTWNFKNKKTNVIIKDYYISNFRLGKTNNKHSQIAINFVNGDQQKGIYLWDLNTHKKIITLDLAIKANDLNFSNDGQKLVSSGEGKVIISDVNTGKKLVSLKGVRKSNFDQVYFSSDDKYIIGASYHDNKLSVWDSNNGRILSNWSQDVSNLDVSKTKNIFTTAHKSFSVKIWSLNTHGFYKRSNCSKHRKK